MIAFRTKVFTKPARDRWSKLALTEQDAIVSKVFCHDCCRLTPMVDFGGRIRGGDLTLEGYCSRCGCEVSRIVAPPTLPSDDSPSAPQSRVAVDLTEKEWDTLRFTLAPPVIDARVLSVDGAFRFYVSNEEIEELLGVLSNEALQSSCPATQLFLVQLYEKLEFHQSHFRRSENQDA